VLLAAVEEEQHTLALEALSAALREVGVASRILGAGVPARALLGAIQRTGPAVVALWAQRQATAHVSVFTRLAAEVRHPLLAAALGPGWRGAPLPPEIARPASLTDAVTMVLHAVPPDDPAPHGVVRAWP
jgi:hypothetical protein